MKKDYSTPRVQKWRENNAMKYCYCSLKSNSKRRGKIFTLTFEQFKRFCVQAEYVVGTGKTKNSFSIDRIDNSKGYTIENIQVLTVSENAKKGTKKKFLRYDYETQTAFVQTKKELEQQTAEAF